MLRNLWSRMLSQPRACRRRSRNQNPKPLRVTRLEERVVPAGDLSFLPASYYLWNSFGALSEPTAGTPLNLALNYLQNHAADLGVGRSDVQNPIVTSQYADTRGGIIHIYLQQ